MKNQDRVLAMFPTARAECHGGIFRIAGVLGAFNVTAINEDLLWETSLRYCTASVKGLYESKMEHESRVNANATSVESILNDSAQSYWFKNALRLALERDPVDAHRDAEQLANILALRVRQVLTP